MTREISRIIVVRGIGQTKNITDKKNNNKFFVIFTISSSFTHVCVGGSGLTVIKENLHDRFHFKISCEAAKS